MPYHQDSSPKEEQDHAANELESAVAASNLRWWNGRENSLAHGDYLLLIVAPYSQYDLAFLDLINSAAVPPRPWVYVANLLHYDDVDQLKADIPSLEQVYQTPIVAIWEDGLLKQSASGKVARDLVADVLGLSAEDLSRRMVSESPKYTAVETG